MATKLFVREEEAPGLKVCTDLARLRTQQRIQFIDVTELVAERVRRSGVHQGVACVQTRHTTTAIVANENEPLLLEDMARALERLAPRDMRYGHNDLALRTGAPPDESQNGDAHCKAMFLGASETVAIVDGGLELGGWQRLFLIELDGPRERTFCVTVMGTCR